MIPRYAQVLAILAVLGAAYWWIDRTGYQRGYAASEARYEAQRAGMQRDLDAANREALQASLDLENSRDAARILAMEADRETQADTNRCIPTSGELRRAKKRWGVSD